MAGARTSGRFAQESVPHSAHGFDHSLVTAWGEHLPNSANVDIHSALLHKNVVAPDFVQKLGAAVNPVGVGHEEVQQTKFGGLEIDFLAVAGNPMRGRIKPQACDLNDLLAQQRRAPAYHRLDSREQLA